MECSSNALLDPPVPRAEEEPASGITGLFGVSAQESAWWLWVQSTKGEHPPWRANVPLWDLGPHNEVSRSIGRAQLRGRGPGFRTDEKCFICAAPRGGGRGESSGTGAWCVKVLRLWGLGAGDRPAGSPWGPRPSSTMCPAGTSSQRGCPSLWVTSSCQARTPPAGPTPCGCPPPPPPGLPTRLALQLGTVQERKAGHRGKKRGGKRKRRH